MLYAPVQAKDYWPLEWEKCFNMHRYLQRVGELTYQFLLERKMFATHDGPEYRCALVKWGDYRSDTAARTREVLVETGDPKHMESVLFVLINEAKAQGNNQQVSMVP